MASRVDQSGLLLKKVVPDGLGFAVTPDGTAQALEGGSLLKENVVAASEYRAENADTTVLLSQKTTQMANSICLRVSKPQTTNGFKTGDLYVLKVDGVDSEKISDNQQKRSGRR